MDLQALGAVGGPSLSHQVGARGDAGDASSPPPHQVDAAGTVVKLPDENWVVLAGTVCDRPQDTGDAGPLTRCQSPDRISAPQSGGALLVRGLEVLTAGAKQL